MSEKKDWDAWKKKEHYIERSIFRQDAEREQLKIVEDDGDWHGNNQLLFREEFLGIIAPGYLAELKLHVEAKPHITILDEDRKLVAIIMIEDM